MKYVRKPHKNNHLQSGMIFLKPIFVIKSIFIIFRQIGSFRDFGRILLGFFGGTVFWVVLFCLRFGVWGFGLGDTPSIAEFFPNFEL